MEFLLLILLIIDSIIIGFIVLKLFNLKFDSLYENIVFSTGIGWGVLAYITFFIGLIGLLYKVVFFIIIAIPLLFLPFIKSIKHQIIKYQAFTFSLSQLLALIVVVIFGFVNLIGTLTPPVYADDIAYHLSLPKIYLLKHRIIDVPGMSTVSNLPQIVEMLYLLGIGLWNDTLAKLINFVLGLCSILSVYTFGKIYFSEKVGCWSVIVISTTPMFNWLSRVAYIEIGETYFLLLSIYALIAWIFMENRNSIFIYILSGIFLGLAIGSKLLVNVMIPIILTIIFIHCISIGKSYRTIVLHIIVYIFTFLLVASPWYIKSYINTGTPVYPFFAKSEHFKSPESSKAVRSVIKDDTLKTNANIEESFSLDSSIRILPGFDISISKIFKSIIYVPNHIIEAFIIGKQKREPIYPSPFGIFYITFIPCLIFVEGVHKGIKYLIFAGVSYIFIFSLISAHHRYMFPAVVILSIVVGYAITKLMENSKDISIPILRVCFKLLIWGIIVVNIHLYFFFSMYPVIKDDLAVVIGIEKKRDYIIKRKENYKVIEYINQNLSDNDKILFLWDPWGYYCDKDYIWGNPNGQNLIRWKEFNSKDELIDKLKQEKITHILVNNNGMMRIMKGIGSVDTDWIKLYYWYNELLKGNLSVLYFADNVTLYRIIY